MAAAMGGPGWQTRITDATISLPFAEDMARLSGHTRPEGQIGVVRTTDSTEKSVTVDKEDTWTNKLRRNA